MISQLKKYSDAYLLEMLEKDSRNKNEAFKELYDRYSPNLLRYCRKMMNDTAVSDDLFQDTFFQFYNSTQNARKITNVKGYLIKIARNLGLNLKNSAKSHENVPLEENTSVFYNTNIEENELSQLIYQALDLLPGNHKEAFILQEYEELSYDEISVILNVPVSTVTNWLYRAKTKLREILSPYLKNYPKVII